MRISDDSGWETISEHSVYSEDEETALAPVDEHTQGETSSASWWPWGAGAGAGATAEPKTQSAQPAQSAQSAQVEAIEDPHRQAPAKAKATTALPQRTQPAEPTPPALQVENTPRVTPTAAPTYTYVLPTKKSTTPQNLAPGKAAAATKPASPGNVATTTGLPAAPNKRTPRVHAMNLC